MANKKLPVLIYVIAIILFIVATYAFVSGMIIAIGIINGDELYQIDKTEIKSVITDSSGEEYETYGENVFISGGIFNVLALMIVTMVFVVLGIGLLKTRRWARIIVIIISILGAIVSIIGFLGGYYFHLIELIIFVAIATYLIIGRGVRFVFKKRKKSS
ncbi:hypothetical protein GOV12_07740 [Candidatus Pacearchaeota archaeon]|nr:hypothetical protein [Candidatus Pacearchaeota archaeon]